MSRQLGILAGAAVALGCIGGCTVGPNFKPPQPGMPLSYLPPTTRPTSNQSVVVDQAPGAELTRWWSNFNDPTLTALIHRVAASNIDIKQAESRIRQARAQRVINSAPLYPTVDTRGGYTRQGVHDTTSDTFQSGFDASWEIDLFGGVRRTVEAANANYHAAVEDRRDVLVTLEAEIALNYLQLRGAQRQIEIAQRNLDTQRHSADLTRQLQGAGFVSGLDTANAESSVATTEAQIPLLEQTVRQSIYGIGVLLGAQPETLIDDLQQVTPLPSTPPVVPAGLPSELLRRRPDIRRAELQFHYATANVGVATADLYPRFNLAGTLAFQNNNIQRVASWNSAAYSFGPTYSWPIFDAGKIRANIDFNNALQEQALLTYEQTVLTAVQEVENALIAYEKEQQHHEALSRAVDANRRALQISTTLYSQGQTDFLNVLTAQRSLLSTEDALVNSDQTISTNLVTLYKALGGGWDPATD